MNPLIKATVTFTEKKLGKGSYGCVKVVKINNVEYAAKCFHEAQQKWNKKFIMKYSTLTSLRHKNIVSYLGLPSVGDEVLPILIMEKLICSLHDRLCSTTQPPPAFPTKLRILLDVAEGLCFLHGHHPAIIHRDLTAKNVLLDSQGLAKISDFGNSTIVQIDQRLTQESTTYFPGAMVYCAPEAMQLHNKYNEKKIDIFSFGHLSLFVFIDEFPLNLLPAVENQDGQLHARSEVKRRQMYFDTLRRYAQVHSQGVQVNEYNICELLVDCLQNRPDKRPPAEDLTKFFKNHPLLAAEHDPNLAQITPTSDQNTCGLFSRHSSIN